MSRVARAHVVSLASLLVGVTLLVASVLFLVDWVQTCQRCHEERELCAPESVSFPEFAQCPPKHLVCRSMSPTVPGATLVIMAAISQFACAVLAFFKKWGAYISLQVLSIMTSLAGFTLVLGNISDSTNYYGSSTYAYESCLRRFLSASGIGFILGSLMLFSVEYIRDQEWEQRLAKQEDASVQHGQKQTCVIQAVAQ